MKDAKNKYQPWMALLMLLEFRTVGYILRHLEINNRPIFGQDFCLSSRRRNRRIAGYVTIARVLMTDKKTSKEG